MKGHIMRFMEPLVVRTGEHGNKMVRRGDQSERG